MSKFDPTVWSRLEYPPSPISFPEIAAVISWNGADWVFYFLLGYGDVNVGLISALGSPLIPPYASGVSILPTALGLA
ncbi:hypothetical protein K440DRAFT_621934 [Wilcoxina mikolae CBS 423.85]|nr:hypothetical protein K440DRAFT_621934 [Wilcoxina mikolae CBS 423.85]